ncbi:MAG: hypothetical protein N4A76_00330 [Firmicutes bacterium]|jgi:hypothetical protein|nr:hypothetical protein [Bacillota bacterium]
MKKKIIIIPLLITLILSVLLINKKSFSEKILENVKYTIIENEDKNYFNSEITNKLLEFRKNMESEGYYEPEVSVFETPQGDKLYILVRASSVNHQDGYAVSYIIFNIVGEKIIDMTISTWATVSPEKRNF